jgi:hypothetical protein
MAVPPSSIYRFSDGVLRELVELRGYTCVWCVYIRGWW